ncbi:type II toxin-antitoxin system VapB family antitoxin [Actinoplanes sp. NPDC048967]|uniref:type II toxin-antitoxin system VapB family antitoxin n=1 Tax=Actinoplanes sp. NPDC048967 TaxID=3155269 RepID=UPI0033FF8E7C
MTDPQEGALTDLATSPITEEEIDAELLAEAQRQISAPSLNAAINEALRRLVLEERGKRRAAMERLQRMHDEGLFDYSQLDAAEE